MVQLTGQEHKLPGQLSGGQQQRVAIARAIVIEPPLILMDEPLSNLDAKLRIETRAEIRRIHRELDRATIYVTHDQDEALSLADRIVVMKDGVVAADRDAAGGLCAARQPARRALHGLPQRARARRRRRAKATASRCPARTSALTGTAQAAAVRRPRGGRDPAGGDRGRRRRTPAATTRSPGGSTNVEYCGRDSLRRRRHRGRDRCSTSAARDQPRVGDAVRVARAGRARARLSRRADVAMAAAADAARARAVRPHAAAGRAGGGCSCCCSSSTRFSTGSGCRSRRRRAARSPTTRTSSRPTICGRRSGRRCKLALPATLINVGFALPIAFKMRVKTPLPALGHDDPGRADHARHRAHRRRHADLFRPEGLARRSSCSSSTSTTDRSASRTTTAGVLISLVISGFPFAFLLILSYITGIDPGLARAAATLGADPKAQFRHIYLPLLAPGLAMCFCLAFVQAFSVFPSAVLLGSPAGPDARDLDRRVRGGVRALRLFARLGDRDDHGLRPARHRRRRCWACATSSIAARWSGGKG